MINYVVVLVCQEKPEARMPSNSFAACVFCWDSPPTPFLSGAGALLLEQPQTAA